jgi:hypothetical protein
MPITPTSTKSKNYQALGIDEIARDIETAFDAINQLEQGGGGSDYTETIVNISSAEILSMGTTPIELLPAAGANAYYDIEKVVLEYTHNTTAYTTTNKYLYLDGVSSPAIPPALITATGNAFQIIKPSACFVDPTDEVAYNANISLNQPITFKAWNSSNPTLGDGTLRVKIYHKTITFGA